MHDKREMPGRAPTGHRRRIDLMLTAFTALLFIAYLTTITAFPELLSPRSVMALGFLLLAYSVGATFLYQLQLERRQNVGGRD